MVVIDAHLCPRALALTTPVISSAPSLPSTLLCNISVGQLTTPYPTTVASSWLTVQFACSTVALACTRVTIPVISWPNTRDLMYEHHTVQCMPRTQAEYQHIAWDVEALTHMVHIAHISEFTHADLHFVTHCKGGTILLHLDIGHPWR